MEKSLILIYFDKRIYNLKNIIYNGKISLKIKKYSLIINFIKEIRNIKKNIQISSWACITIFSEDN